MTSENNTGRPSLQLKKELCKVLEERLRGTEELLKVLFPQRRIHQLIIKYETSRGRKLSIEEWRTLCKTLGVEREFLDRVQSQENGRNPENIKTRKGGPHLSDQQEKDLCKFLEERLGGTEELLKALFPQKRIYQLIFKYETSRGRPLSIEEWRTLCKRLGVEQEFSDRVQSFEIGRNPENIKTRKEQLENPNQEEDQSVHIASRAEPFTGTGNSLVSGSNRHLGGPSNAESFRDLFSLRSNYISRNTSTTANNYPPQSAFEELEQFGREIERKEQLIREQRARERRAREERELREAENWPQQQEAITARSQWLCEHFQRHCRVRFPCCTQFYPCQLCHNISKACDNEEAEACQATHLKCSYCQHEQEIGEDSAKCRKCGGKMSVYFCAICKHFTSMDKNPYHCEKCGICRLHQDKSFHCEVCNVCLNKVLEGSHKCRPDSGHDKCCICLEDAFSGCQILPCSHKVHRECGIAMIQYGIRTCPICRHPLYSQSRE